MKSLVQNIKEIIFSKKCPICNKIHDENEYICLSCYIELRKKWRLKNIDNYYYLCYYEKDIKALIADFKLKNRKKLGVEIANLIRKPLKNLIVDKGIDFVIPVPISRERMLERGFNQIEELLKICGINYENIERKKNTKHMYELSDTKERKKNIYDAFVSSNKFDNKSILIVDDIVTTGSTIKEIVREIRKNNAPKNIYVFSIAISKKFKN